jgi:hypothetical protein
MGENWIDITAVIYLGFPIVHDSHTVKQSDCVSPKVITTMGSWETLEPDHGCLIFHLPSFTSIQWALIPWNAIFIMFADHPSIVTETFPGAAWVVVHSECLPQMLDEYYFLQLSPSLVPSCASQIDCEGSLLHCRCLGDQPLSISDAWTPARFGMRSYQWVLEAIIVKGEFVLLCRSIVLKLTWLLLAISVVTAWRVPMRVNSQGPVTTWKSSCCCICWPRIGFLFSFPFPFAPTYHAELPSDSAVC